MDAVCKAYLLQYGYEERFSVKEDEISSKLSFVELRDRLIRIGHILEENKEEQIYVVSIKAGLWGINNALIVCKLELNKLCLAGYAREGIIKQNTTEKAMDMIKEICNEK